MDIGKINSLNRTASWSDPALSLAQTTTIKEQKNTVQLANAVKQPGAAVKEQELGQALQSINKALEKIAPTLKFSIDDESDRVIVKVVDQQTTEVIRQMPTEEALAISKAIEKLQGLLVSQHA